MRGMLSLLTGLAQGTTEGQTANAAAERQARMDQIQLDRAQRDSEQYDREKSMQSQLDAAAQPDQVAVKPPTADNIDVGSDPTAAPTMQPGPALTADQIAQRQQPIVQKFDPARGLAMQASMMQVQAEKTKLAQQSFDDGLSKAAAGGWDSLMDYTNKSGASPAQHRAIPNVEDGGKTVKIMTVQPDGSLTPTGQVYPADQSGALLAADMLSQATPIQAKVAHYLAERRQTTAENRQSNMESHYAAMEDIGNRNADANNARADAAERRAAARETGGLNKLPEADKLTLQDLNKRSEQISAQRVKMAADPTFDPSTPEGKRASDTLDKMERDIAIQRRALAQKADGMRDSGDPMKRTPGSQAPAAGGSRTDINAPDNDRARIYTEELKKPQSDSDRAALVREIGRLPAAVRSQIKGLDSAPLPGASTPSSPSGQTASTPDAVIDPKSSRPMPTPQQIEGMSAAVARQTTKAPSPQADAGTRLDATRAAYDAAKEAVGHYGLRQQQSDPTGYAAAKRALQAAADARDAAQSAYEQTVSPEMKKAAIRYPKVI